VWDLGRHRQCDCPAARAEINTTGPFGWHSQERIDSELRYLFGFWAGNENSWTNRKFPRAKWGFAGDVL
jgi:hypothetical protein